MRSITEILKIDFHMETAKMDMVARGRDRDRDRL